MTPVHRGGSHRPLSAGAALAAYVVLDAVAAGMGMGVPIFCILLGFPVGWYATRIAQARLERDRARIGEPPSADASVAVLRRVLLYALVASGVTFLGMAALWGRWAPAAFDPRSDFVRTGIPLWLYEPRASFIGWLVLMIVVSPVLQLLAIVFGSHLALVVRARKRADG